MQVEIKKIPHSQIEISIQLDRELLDFYQKAIFQLGKDLQAPGFRKGTLPQEMILRMIDKKKIADLECELAIRESYLQVIIDKNLEPISQPQIKILKFIPEKILIFKVKTQILPEISLPDYRQIASQAKKREVLVEEKEVEETLNFLQRSRAKLWPKKEPAQFGDLVEIDYHSPQVKEDQLFQDRFILGQGGFLPGFEKNLEGMRENQEKEFSLSSGKKILNFKVKMKQVSRVELPTLDDHFAQSLGRFENLKNLKQSIREGILAEKEFQESQRLRQEIVEKISSQTKFEIPTVLIEAEQERMVGELKENLQRRENLSLEDFLKRIGQSENQLRDSFFGQAKERVKRYLILREIGKAEKIKVLEEEVREEINQILKHFPSLEQAQRDLDLEQLKSYTKEAIRNEKILKKLESFAYATHSHGN